MTTNPALETLSDADLLAFYGEACEQWSRLCIAKMDAEAVDALIDGAVALLIARNLL